MPFKITNGSVRLCFVTTRALTRHVQEERRGVITQRVLCQRRDTEYSSRLVDVLDPLLSPAQVGIGHGGAVAEVQLDVGPQGVSLKHSRAGRHSATDEHYALTSCLLCETTPQQSAAVDGKCTPWDRS